MNDLIQLLPHCKKDNKLDTKNDRNVINEVADMKVNGAIRVVVDEPSDKPLPHPATQGCSSVIFFEVRKKQDLYLWLAKSPAGPSVKFLVQNVHTMAELKLSGNCLKGSRPVLSFDKTFDNEPHLQVRDGVT